MHCFLVVLHLQYSSRNAMIQTAQQIATWGSFGGDVEDDKPWKLNFYMWNVLMKHTENTERV